MSTPHSGTSHSKATSEFRDAYRAASLRRLWSRLTGRNDDLIPFEDFRQTVGAVNQRYRGLQAVPLDKIIGSMGRSGDFDRVFMPRQTHSRGKWISVDSAVNSGVTLPPISLYKVGDAYFVVDGHHRVSVARSKGQAFIDAEVTEVHSRVPVTPDLKLEDLDNLAARREFLEETKLDTLRPDQDVHLTMPGDYAKLIDHMRVHKYFMDREQQRELPWEEGVAHWYDHVYMPLVRTIRQNDLLRDFPGHTEADLYIWIIDHAYYLSQKLGQNLAGWEAAKDFVRRFSRRPRRLFERLRRSIIDLIVPDALESGPRTGLWREERVEPGDGTHLFRDILVTITGADSGWRALAQAAEFAQREDSVIHGLHVARSDDEEALQEGERVLEAFTQRCASLGLQSSTSLVVGNVAENIIERSYWCDMVVINQRRDHGRWAERPLGTIFQTVAAQVARPVLAVPGNQVMPLNRVVLAYDGSAKSREALFVLRHLVSCWGVSGVLLTVEGGGVDDEQLDLAWQYAQELGGGEVITRQESGDTGAAILRVMEEEQANLLLLGGYGRQPLLKAFLGSTVDHVLRQAWFPVLICR